MEDTVNSTEVLSSVVLTPVEQGSMVLVDIDPTELVVDDMPVDDEHVKELIDSLPAHGGQIVFPPYVWLQGKRIIDGFHRVTAARKTGMQTITVALVDVSETRFWDLRIMAAKPHKRIEDKRLYEWVIECWKADWGDSKPREEIANNLWSLFRGEIYRQSGSLFAKLDRSRLNGEQVELYDWFANKSARWGIPVESLADRVLSFWNIVPPSPKVDEIAVKKNLTLPERNNLAAQAQKSTAKPRSMEKWIDAGQPGTLRDFDLQDRRQKATKKVERQKQFVQTDIGKEQIQQRNLVSYRDAVQRALAIIKSVEYIRKSVPEAPMLLSTIQGHIRILLQDTPVEIEQVLLENARLVKTNADLQRRIASLERALDTKEKTVVSSNVLALSAIQIPSY
jgi:hypothetical protein